MGLNAQKITGRFNGGCNEERHTCPGVLQQCIDKLGERDSHDLEMTSPDQTVDLMRVLSVPQLSSGTVVDLVRGHPLLTNRQLTYLRYAGSLRETLNCKVRMQIPAAAAPTVTTGTHAFLSEGFQQGRWAAPNHGHAACTLL